MSDLYFAVKLVHILGAAVLFGTGLGMAFFLWMADRTQDAATIAATARIVVIADFVFTATAVVGQPLSGAGLIAVAGYSWRESWIAAALALYLLAGICWLPVVFIQIRMRDIAAMAAREHAALPEQYRRLFRLWFALGWPAFIAVILIYVDMIVKPELW